MRCSGILVAVPGLLAASTGSPAAAEAQAVQAPLTVRATVALACRVSPAPVVPAAGRGADGSEFVTVSCNDGRRWTVPVGRHREMTPAGPVTRITIAF